MPYKQISVTLPEEDYQWLKSHPEVNISGLLQSCIKDMKKKLENK
jgi:hypothetical protein